jgi:hypothetical protein
MAEIISQTLLLGDDEILELKAPYIPAPIIDKLKERGFDAWSVQKGEVVLNYFRKSNTES